MKIEVIKRFFDVELGDTVQIGHVYEVSTERGEYLLNHPSKLVKLISRNHDTNPPLKTESSYDNKEKVERVFQENKTTPEKAEEKESETTEPNLTELDLDSMSYNEKKKEVTKRGLKPENWRTETLDKILSE